MTCVLCRGRLRISIKPTLRDMIAKSTFAPLISPSQRAIKFASESQRVGQTLCRFRAHQKLFNVSKKLNLLALLSLASYLAVYHQLNHESVGIVVPQLLSREKITKSVSHGAFPCWPSKLGRRQVVASFPGGNQQVC